MVHHPMNDAEAAPSIPTGTLMAGKRGLIMGVAKSLRRALRRAPRSRSRIRVKR